MYSPSLGRWVQQDPAGYVDGMSGYQAVVSDPIMYVDPTGLDVHLRPINGRVVNKSSHQVVIGGDWRVETLKTRFGIEVSLPIYEIDRNNGLAVQVEEKSAIDRLSAGEDSNDARDGERTLIVDADHILETDHRFYIPGANTAPAWLCCNASSRAPLEDVDYLKPGGKAYKLPWYGRLTGHYQLWDCKHGDTNGIIIQWSTVFT